MNLPHPDNALANEFVTTDIFDQLLLIQYQRRVSGFLLEKKWYKLIDAIEEITNLWNFGSTAFKQMSGN